MMGPNDVNGRMSEFESLMWTLDGDERLSSTVGNLTMLDQSPDGDRLESRLRRAAVVVERLHQRVASSPGGLAPPRWEDDPDFDLRRHLRRERLGRHNGQRALLDRVMEIFATPFDRDRPLWEFVVIDGLPRHRSAMLQRIHHSLTDGEGGLRISSQFIDLERDAAPPPDVEPIEPTAHMNPIIDAARFGWGRVTDGARSALSIITHPGDLVSDGGELIGLTRSTLRQARLSDHRLSPLWTERSLERRLDLLDLPLDSMKAAAARLGGTVNDVFVTGAASAAGAYHRALGCPTDALRMSMPISTRVRGQREGNHFSPSQTVVPTGDVDEGDRFLAIHQLLRATRDERAVGSVDTVARAANLVPAALLRTVGVRLAGSVDFVTSNLRAAPFEVYLAGARMESNHPIGPLAGTAFNLTTMSYRGTLWLGLVTDPAAVQDPQLMVSCLNNAYRQLLTGR